jgi:hypothetical protein
MNNKKYTIKNLICYTIVKCLVLVINAFIDGIVLYFLWKLFVPYVFPNISQITYLQTVAFLIVAYYLAWGCGRIARAEKDGQERWFDEK